MKEFSTKHIINLLDRVNKFRLLSIITLILISVSAYAQPANDNFANSIDVTGIINGCSADAAYTTINGTPDLVAGSNWNNSGPKFNVWFKFTAPASGQINVTVDRGGSKGGQRYTQIAIWQSDGTTQIASERYTYTTEDVAIGALGLTPGATYYISVDSFNTSTFGTFTLCLEDAVDYDFYEGAIDVTGFINGCSPDAVYDTRGGTPDRNAGSNWDNSGPKYNRWFKFTAPTTSQINVTVDINGAKGNQRYTQIAIWHADGTTEIASKRYSSITEDVVLSVPGLTSGNTYYISVDSFNSSTFGTFTLCLDAVNPTGQIVINEVLFDQSTGTSSGQNDEFIELYNNSAVAVDLAGWQLIDGNLLVNDTDGTGSITGSTTPFTFICSGSQVCSGPTILQPSEYAVIWVGSQTASKNAAGATFQAWLGQSAKLNNNGDDMWLYDAATTLVDYIAFGTNNAVNIPPLPTIWDNTYQNTLDNTPKGQSISLTPNGVDGNASDCWEPTTSTDASARCATYLPTRDRDVTSRVASPGLTNNGLDTDNDGVIDDDDLDDDNDGISDSSELCASDNFSNGNGGGTHLFNYTNVIEVLVNLTTVDNSFQIDANGTTIHSNILQLESGNFSPGDVQMVFQSDGTQISAPWVANSNGLPRIQVIINQLGKVTVLGSRTTTSTFLEVMVTNDGSLFNSIIFPIGATTFTVINPNDGGPDGILGIVNVQCDTDSDGIVNRLDLDSDNDGIYDIVEGGALAQAGVNDSNNDGIIDGTLATFGSNGLFNSIENNDTLNAILTYTIEESIDDADTIVNFLDLDSDGDGIPDNVEAQTTLGYTSPSGNDIDNNGVDDAYDTNGSPITPTNTDGVDNPDYLDTDSDNEAGNDTTETGITLANADFDNDGLDDATDATADYSDPGGTIDNPLTAPLILPDVDNDATTGGDVDFRDAQSDADLSLTKTVDNAAPDQGDNITFTLTLSNVGPSAPINIIVKDIIPIEFTYTHPNFNTTQGAATFNVGTREFEWNLGTFVLGSGNTITLTYTLTVGICGEFINQAEIINSSLVDPDSTPNNGQ